MKSALHKAKSITIGLAILIAIGLTLHAIAWVFQAALMVLFIILVPCAFVWFIQSQVSKLEKE